MPPAAAPPGGIFPPTAPPAAAPPPAPPPAAGAGSGAAGTGSGAGIGGGEAPPPPPGGIGGGEAPPPPPGGAGGTPPPPPGGAGCAIASDDEIARARIEIRNGIEGFFVLGSLLVIGVPLLVIRKFDNQNLFFISCQLGLWPHKKMSFLVWLRSKFFNNLVGIVKQNLR